MCVGCLKEKCPNRGTICNDTGGYLLNYSGCKICNNMQFPKMINREVNEDQNGGENIKYEHVCENCGHLIATHEYNFTIDQDEGYQEFEMNCLLCGFGEDRSNIIP